MVVRLDGEVRDTAILIVENDEAIYLTLKDRLKQQRYRVTLTGNAQDALELAEQIQFDLIFIEANLLAMKGLELYQAIKKVIPHAAVIMISDQDEVSTSIADDALRCTPMHSDARPIPPS